MYEKTVQAVRPAMPRPRRPTSETPLVSDSVLMLFSVFGKDQTRETRPLPVVVRREMINKEANKPTRKLQTVKCARKRIKQGCDG